MRIVHVSNFTMKWNGESFFTIPYKLNNGLTRLGHNVFSVCDRDIADSYFLGIRGAGRQYANRKLQRICEEVRPDLVLLGHCTLISPSTVASLRDIVPRVRIAHWNCDPLFYSDIMRRLRSLAPLVDATFVTTAGPLMSEIAEGGGRVAFMPNPVDKSIETIRVFEKVELETDLVFIGSPIKERAATCEAIRRAIPDLKFETHGFGGAPAVFGANLFALLGRSKMGLSLSRRDDVFLYASDRMSIMMGCGLLTFVDRRSGFDTIFRDDELALYGDLNELVDKIRMMKADDARRKETARRGWQKIHEVFSETRIAEWIIGVTFGGLPRQPPAWPSTICGSGCKI
jgi:hypothetical protein